MSYPAISLSTATADRHRRPQKRLRPPANLPSTRIRARIIAPATPSPLFRCPHALHPGPSVDSDLVVSRFLETKRADQPDYSLNYSPAAVVDGYQVLRQFIDNTDELHYCLMVVFAPPSFLTNDQRGVRKYDALYLRIWDEVRDRRRANPLSSMVRISPSQEKVIPQAARSHS